jgi:hypothetical protein
MSRERGETASDPLVEPPEADPAAGAGGRETGLLESLVQEWLRRAASAGFSTLRFTEEAIRRGFSDAMPPEWVDYVSRQSVEVRSEMIDRFAREFGTWLRELDVERLLGRVLEHYRFRATIEVEAAQRAGDERPARAIARR